MPDKLICAWVSRHPPLSEQRASLAAYAIRQMSQRQPDADAIWLSILDTCGTPDLIMLVTARAHWTPIVLRLNQYAPHTPIIRPVMLKTPSGSWEWTGEWEQSLVFVHHRKASVRRELWTPAEAVRR